MKIGIYLAYAPGMVLATEGLGRHLSYLLKGFLSANHQVTIACPEWVLKHLHELCEDNQIDENSIHFLTVRSPAIFRAMQWLNNTRKKQKKTKRPFKPFRLRPIEWFVAWVLSIPNILPFTMLLMILLVAAVILAIPAALFGLLLIAKKAVSKVMRRIRPNIAANTAIHENGVWRSPLRSLKQHLKQEAKRFLGSSYPGDDLLDSIQTLVQKRLVKKINRVEEIDIWYSPTLNWPLFSDINKPKVRNYPDLVTTVFATGFTGTGMLKPTDIMRNVIKNERFFITYSEHIKKDSLLSSFRKDQEDVVVIPHGTNDMMPYIDVYPNVKRLHYPETANATFAKERLRNIVLPYAARHQRFDAVTSYFANLNTGDIRYLFYSSQIRPSKNIFTLLRAYEYLLRKKYIQIKLFLTGEYFDSPEITNYIFERGLEYDVISISRVPTSSLAGLYACADLVVNPTLYEGGFPFTFTEGMSVGTPSVMGKIPQVLEVLEGREAAEYLFDPYDWKDVADKIEFGLNNRAHLYEVQKPIYDKLSERTWDTVAEDYIRAFEYFIKRSNEAPVV